MTRNGIRYKDTIAAPGSKLYEAITSKDMKLAERIYQECERDLKKWVVAPSQAEGLKK